MSNQPCTICRDTNIRASFRSPGFAGKVVRGDFYFHVSATQDISGPALTLTTEAYEIASLQPTKDFNVVKIAKGGTVVSLLSYAQFFEDAFPALEKAYTVNMVVKSFRERSFSSEQNPPILHKKELLLSPTDPHRPLFEKLTQLLEERSIRPNKPGLGFRRQWGECLTSMGVEVRSHRIVGLVNDHN